MKSLYLNHALVFIDGELHKRHLKLQNTKITEISSTAYPSENAIDCKSKWILPGCIDPHVHFRTPGHEHKEDWDTGSKAALAGGVTAVIDMPNTNPPTTTLEALTQKRHIAAQTSRVHFAFHFGATNTAENIQEIKRIKNLASIKIYFGSSTGSLLLNTREQIQEIFKVTKVPVSFHAEDERMIRERQLQSKSLQAPNTPIHNYIRNDSVAEAAIRTILEYTKDYAHVPVYICHVSTQKEHELILQAKNHRTIYSEITPHHLFLTENLVYDVGQFSKVNPPLRDEHNRAYIAQALQNNQIDTYATDHAPHSIPDKLQAYQNAASGMPGLETLLPTLLSEVHKKKLSIQQLVRVCSENPARIFGIQGKAYIGVGYDADIVVVDPHKQWTLTTQNIYSKARWNPFLGQRFTGKVTQVFIHGLCAYHEGQFYPTRGTELQCKHS